MSTSSKTKTEHTGDKGSSQSGGYRGSREEAKRHSNVLRRREDRAVCIDPDEPATATEARLAALIIHNHKLD